MPRREDGPVKDSNLNLNGLTFLVADPSAYFCTVIHGILRSFGASKVLETRDARGVVQLDIIYPLAQLGLARAKALAGDTAGARTAYQDFLAAWKNADSDLPILKEAKVEYARLQ